MTAYTTRGGIVRTGPARYALADQLADLRARRRPLPNPQQMNLAQTPQQRDLDAQAARAQAPPGGPVPIRRDGLAEHLAALSPDGSPPGSEAALAHRHDRLASALADGRVDWGALSAGDWHVADQELRKFPLEKAWRLFEALAGRAGRLPVGESLEVVRGTHGICAPAWTAGPSSWRKSRRASARKAPSGS
jgi:hypothetical protein